MHVQTAIHLVFAAALVRAFPANGPESKRATPELSLNSKLRLAET